MISVKFGSDMCVVAIFPTHIIFIADLYESVCVCVCESMQNEQRQTFTSVISNGMKSTFFIWLSLSFRHTEKLSPDLSLIQSRSHSVQWFKNANSTVNFALRKNGHW